MYDWYFDKGEQYIRDYITDPEHSSNDIVHIEFTYLELGKDEKWLKSQVRALNNDMLTVKRELFLEWTLASSVSPFSEEALSIIDEKVATMKPYGKIRILDYVFNVIEYPKGINYRNFIVSVDVAGGLGRDASAISVIDPADQKIKMYMKNNFISTRKLCDLLIELVTLYIPQAVVVIESNNAGISVISDLKESSIKSNLYYTRKIVNREVMVDAHESRSLFDSLKRTRKETNVYGVATTKVTRDIMINEILNMIVNDRPELVNNKELLSEIKTLERKSNGKIEHMKNKHDDLLFSYLVGLYVLIYDPKIGNFLKVIHTKEELEENEEDEEIISQTQKTIRSMNNMRRVINTSQLYNNFPKRKNLNDELSEENNADKIQRMSSLFKK